jgi:hypothetical protein
MSAQTINITSLSSLFNEVESELIKNAIKLLHQKYFKLGDGYDSDEQAHYLKMYQIINKNYCPLNEFLYTVLKDGVQEDKELVLNVPSITKQQEVKPVDTLYQLWLNKGNIGTFNDFLDVLFNSDVDVWEESEW